MRRHLGLWLLAAAALALSPACVTPPPSLPTTPPVALALPAAPAEPSAPPSEPEPPPRRAFSGIGPIRIGQPIDEVRRLLGQELRLVLESEERDGWINAGYDPDHELVFLLGFDELLVYEQVPPGLPPYWKIYARDGRVVLIKVSAFLTNATGLDEVGFPPACFLTLPGRGVTQTFGQPDLLEQEREGAQQTYHYLERGLSVIVVDGAIQVFDVFGDLSLKERERVRHGMAAASR